MTKAFCKNCKTTIESRHVHDYVTCPCFENKSDTTGIMLDGGNEYLRCGGNMYNFVLIEGLDGEIITSTEENAALIALTYESIARGISDAAQGRVGPKAAIRKFRIVQK